NANLTLTKSTNKQFATIGETISYTILITNSGNTAATNVQLTDPLPNGTILTPGTVTLNGVLQNVDSLVALPIGTIPGGATFTLSFQVTVINITAQNPIINNAFVSYLYSVNPSLPPTSKTANSNSVTSTIRLANLQATKSVDKTFAEVGDVLTYTFALTNDGNVAANNVLLSDSIANGTAFVPNSVTINNVTQPGVTPASINIGSINAGTTITASFQVLITSIPNPNPISNNASISYNFIVDPNASPVSKNTTSTTTFTQVNDANVISAKTVDRAFATVGDVLTYSILLTNAGSVSADSPTFVDTNPDGTTFIPNTFLINGLLQNNADPNIGVPLPSIPANGSLTVSYQVTVTSLPAQNPTINSSSTQYSFILNPGDPPTIETSLSNTVSTQINLANVIIFKDVDLTIADVGQPITYTIALANPGNSPANNVIVTDMLPPGTTLVPNSIFIGGALQLGADPSVGLHVGTIPAGGITTIVFQISANSLPSPNPVQNSAALQYSFIADPNLPAVVRNATSNIVTTQINTATIVATKLTSTNFADVGAVITYATILTNNGNIPASNVTFTDIIPAGTIFLPNTVTINGVPIANANPANGILIGTIGANSSRTVAFQVSVPTIPSPNPITNQSSTTFQYTYDASKSVVTQMVASNTVQTTINNATIAAVKSADKHFANVNDIITYTTTLTNNGNTLASNVIFTDVIPNGTSFIPNSVTVNGNTLPNTNPASGIAIDPINPNTSATISFQVIVNSIPSPNPIPNQSNTAYQYVIDPNLPPASANALSNVITTQINNATIVATKSVNTPTAAIGDIVTYTIAVTNTGNIPASATVLTDGLGAGASFVPNSVTIDNIPQPGLDPSLGIHLADIPPGDTVFITFQAQILAIPPSGTLTNNALVNYEYTVNPNQSPAVGSTVTNTTVTPIIDATLSINKTVNSRFATIGDTLTFTAIITNSGNTTANNVIFTDVIPNGTSFIPNSFTVNGTTIPNANPQNGINIGNLNSNASATLSFQVNITSLPNPNPIPNQSSLQYSFIVGINEPPVSRTVQSNKTFTQVNTASVIATKTASSAFAAVGDTITYTTTLTNSGNTTANTPVFIDILPPELSFVPDSVQINTIPQLGFRPDSGISLDSIPVGGTTTISFQAIVGSIPVTNPTLNQSSTTYSIIVDPTQPPVTETATSNPTLVQINEAIIQATKSVDRLFSDVAPGNSFLTYTVLLENIGNTTATNIIFTDPIPNNTVFIADSVRVGGVLLPGVNPANGVPIGDIIAGDFTNITFRVQVVSIPNPIFTIGPGGPNSPVVNGASIDYQFMTGPNLPLVSRSTTSNPVSTQINSGEITLVKSVDKTFATIGDTISYTITLSNPGNVTSQNIIFTDILPDGTTFISGTLTNDSGTQQIGNPANGIQIGNINPNGTAVITLNVLVTNIPSINPISNSSSVQFSHVVDPSQPSVSQMNVSNAVSTTINSAILTTQKSADKSIVSVGDTITYTTTITNTGNTAATNITFTSAIPASITFIPNSFTINGVQQSGAQPALGVTIPNIAPGETVTVTFQVNVISVPPSNSIMGNDTILYSYTVDPNGTPITTSISTNIVTNPVLDAMITMVKSVDQTLVTLGDTITYTTILTNSGNTNATNITFTDLIPDGTTFITDSVTIDGITQIGLNPNTGITIGLIAPNSSISIAFQVTATSTPAQNPIANSATASYTFIADPNAPIVSRTVTSNTVFTTINTATILSLKQVDKSFSRIGDTLTYTVALTNNGNSSAQNVIFTDTVPSGTAFIADTFSINGILQSGANPVNGVNIGTITAGTTVTISFQVTVTSLPTENPIVNFSSTSYQLVSPPDAETSISNPVSTQIKEALLSMTKNESVSFADIGQTAFYTTSISNIGNTDATNIVFTDVLPNGVTFVPNTLTVDGVLQPDANPNTGVLLATLPPNEIYSIVFQVTVNSIPPINPAPNTASTTYEFTVDPVNPPVLSAATSNTTLLQINNANIISTKTTDLTFADVGNTITFTLNLPNTGNVTATDVTVIDTLDSNLTFVPNSFTVNGQTIPNADLSTGVNIGSINGGTAAIITFQATVTTLPINNPISNSALTTYRYIVDPDQSPITTSNQSNTTTTQINSAILTAQKNSNVSTVDIGQDIIYSVTITNSGNVNATNVIFTDVIPDGTSFEPNSFTLNGTIIENANTITGVPIGDIAPGDSATITFQFLANSIPPQGAIINQALTSYIYIVDPSQPPVTATSSSNTVNTAVVDASLSVIKNTDSLVQSTDGTITYTVVVQNNGNTTANTVTLTDLVPEGTAFIPDSVTINGVSAPGTDPNVGISLNSIAPSEIVTVTFQVIVQSIPSVNPISNIARIDYTFIADPTAPIISRTITSNPAFTQISDANVLSLKAVNAQQATTGDILTYTITLENTGNIPATNLIFSDTLPEGTTFVDNSFTLNGTTILGANPNVGVTLPNLAANATHLIAFQVLINDPFSQQSITNQSNTTYTIQPDPGQPPITETSTSNIVITNFVQAQLTITKTSNPITVDIGGTILYISEVKNSGNVDAINIIFTDSIPVGTTFVLDSVTINGVLQPDANPENGIPIGKIPPNSSKTILFQVQTNNPPTETEIVNQSSVTYQYISIPTAPPVNRSANSNIVTTSLQNANIISVKSEDVTFVSIGQFITYTNTLQNIGTVPANNTVFIDNIPEGTIFIEDSLSINNVIQPGTNPENGVTLGTIQPDETVTISFQVQLTNIPEDNTVINISDTSYEYQIDPSSPIIQRRSLSNTVNTEVRTANVSAIKSANRSITRIGQIITYTIAVTNAGTVPITNTLLIDAIAAGTTFVPDSILVDGIPRPNENPSTGISLNIILPNNTIIVTFQVNVDSIPSQNNMNNIAVIHYEYQPDQSLPPISETTSSNTTNIQFIDAILIATKSANTVLANIDETIEYTVLIQNNGSTTTNSIFFTDIIEDGTVFISGSVTVNNTVLPAADPNIGFSIPNITSGQVATITFQVSVTNLPAANPTPNTANIVYDFIFNPDFAPIQKSTTSNTTFVQINDADIVSLKTVDLTSVTIGDVLTYTTTLTNTGNTDATALVFTDNIPGGTTFIDGSVLVNNIPQLNANPSTGILLGTIAPNISIPVTFSVTVVALPASGRIQNQSTSRYTINSEEQISTSNITFTEVISANIIATKTTPIQYADLQTIIPYTISITNNGNIQVENIIVTDIIPANTSFIENSVIVNGSARPNDNPLSGIQLDNIPPNTTATILFQVRVTSIPQTNPISNTSTIEYQYTLPNQPPITETIISSAAVTTINHATLNSNKTVDLAFATVGDALTYTITLNQTGNVAVNDVIIQDIIPQGTTFIENSVIVNGETLPGVNPVSGIPIGTIIVDGDAIVSFQVTVTTIPTPNELNNNAITTFNYIVNPNNVPVTNTTTTNTVTTTVQNDNVIAIKSVDVTNALPAQTLTYTITIMNSGNVTIEDLLVIDTIPIDTTFVAGSVTINGINQPNENPENGITLGNLAHNDSVIITFQVTISSSTLQPTINNDATVSYTVIIDPDEPPITITKQTNTVTTTLIEPIINIEKTADKSIVVIGDVITFTLEVFNDSTIPTISTSVIDTIPAGTTFIENSVTINGTSVPNVRPDTGINIGSLSAGTVATITFQVLVTSIPSNSTIINSATVTAAFQLTPQDPIITFIVNPNIVRIPVQFITTTVTKNASVSSAYLNQYFDYTVRITNTSKISLSNISLQDTIPAGLQFINGTVFINGERSPLANPNIGFLVATNLEPNETIIVLFTVQVISPPVNNEFKNTANISLQLQVSPTDPPITVTVTSNENIVTFVPENPDETLPNLNCFFDGERFIRITPRNIRNYLWAWIWWQ
ncbi:DUF7507 domain-containing protein, partial [Bacillus mobilis]|uniref:DUF7507 domain-containing protein n=1 Tax=Bacillus mobilis TaxID=2026190 RepID=UPI0011A8B1AB